MLFCSSFQHPFYPYTGHESDTAHVVNIPLPAGANGQKFRQEVEAHWMPALHKFKPQLVMISAGFDGHLEDEMGQLLLQESDYAWISGELKEIAKQYADGRVISSLEGGYALGALGRSVAAHLDALHGFAFAVIQRARERGAAIDYDGIQGPNDSASTIRWVPPA